MLDYAAGPPSVGQSGPDLYMGGVSLSLELDRGKRSNPTLRWSMWVPQILVTQPHWQLLWWCLLLSRPEQAVLSVGSLSGYSNMTGHEEPAAQLSRVVMPLFFPVEEEPRA